MLLNRLLFVTLALLATLATPLRAQTVITTGVDAWHIGHGPARYLPDYAPTEPWKPVAAWGSISTQHRTDTAMGMLTLSLQARAHQVAGQRIDRLDADLRLTDATGLRLGVLPYRMSWCRTYDARSPWIAEPDAFCRFAGLNEISQGAFGTQAYTSTQTGGWLIDGMAGVYRPMIDGQNDKLGPYVSVGPTVLHHTRGISLNALHLATGLQLRAGWLQTLQHQNSNAGSFQRRMDYDTRYLAAEANLTPATSVRASLSAYVGNQINPAQLYGWHGQSTSIELAHRPAPGHTLALGLSRYTNDTTYVRAPHHQRLDVPSASVAWRADLPGGFYSVVQASHTEDDNRPRTGPATLRTGTAIGLRVGRIF
jgi:hypothetical protein